MGWAFNPFTCNLDLTGSGGGGTVVGPSGGSTDNAIARFDGTTGTLLQNSTVLIDDSGNITNVTSIAATTVNSTNTNISSATASRAAIIDASKNIASSVTTSTEIGYVAGVTSAIQTQLNDKIPLAQKGANNGVATLDSGGKIPTSQLPNSVMEYQGTWSAATNTPTLTNGIGNAGDVYLNTAAGSVDFGSGSITFAIGDWAVYSGSIWQKSINSNAVVSVNSQTGVIVLTTSDISEGSNLYYTDERAQDSVGTILADTASIDFTYNDGGPSISASVLPAGVDHNSLQNYVANQHVDHSTVSIATASSTSGLTGGGNITATRNLSVDIIGTTAETVPSNTDSLLIYDASASALKSMTRGNLLSGFTPASAGDITETSFSASNNQVAAANITGLAFANGTVRSFKAILSITLDATADLFAQYTLNGIQKASSWEMDQAFVGDSVGMVFSITSAGQVQYTSPNSSGFVSNTLKFRAETTSV